MIKVEKIQNVLTLPIQASLMYERCVARQGRRWAWAVIFYGFYVIFIWISQLFLGFPNNFVSIAIPVTR